MNKLCLKVPSLNLVDYMYIYAKIGEFCPDRKPNRVAQDH